jgi:Recombination endonuclease VII
VKTCTKCDVEKTLASFSPNRGSCKQCGALGAAQWRKEHPERHLASTRSSKLRSYGLTEDQYREMHDQQRGLCAICTEPCKLGRRLAVDHCHTTGRVRGLLCARCNMSIGKFEDRVELLQSAISYLQETRP